MGRENDRIRRQTELNMKITLVRDEALKWMKKVRVLTKLESKADISTAASYIDEGKQIYQNVSKVQLENGAIIQCIVGTRTFNLLETFTSHQVNINKLHTLLDQIQKKKFENDKRKDNLLKSDGLKINKLDSIYDLL